MYSDFYLKIQNLQKKNVSFVIASVVNKKGHCPQIPGAKIIIANNNDIIGTVGGGELELRVIEESKKILSELLTSNERQTSFTREYILSENNGQVMNCSSDDTCIQTNMLCGGRITIFYDVNNSKDNIYIFGGGHVGSSIWYYMSRLDVNINIIDSRRADDIIGLPTELADIKDTIFIHSEYEQHTLDNVNFVQNSYFIVVTHSHESDYLVLNYLYNNSRKLKPKYIGVIASKSKSETILKRLTSENKIYTETIEKIYCPIGLKTGGTTPSDIALSISAELQSIRYNTSVDDKVTHHTKNWIKLLNLKE